MLYYINFGPFQSTNTSGEWRRVVFIDNFIISYILKPGMYSYYNKFEQSIDAKVGDYILYKTDDYTTKRRILLL